MNSNHAPEILSSKPMIDEKVDCRAAGLILHALIVAGLILYALLVGSPPFWKHSNMAANIRQFILIDVPFMDDKKK